MILIKSLIIPQMSVQISLQAKSSLNLRSAKNVLPAEISRANHMAVIKRWVSLEKCTAERRLESINPVALSVQTHTRQMATGDWLARSVWIRRAWKYIFSWELKFALRIIAHKICICAAPRDHISWDLCAVVRGLSRSAQSVKKQPRD